MILAGAFAPAPIPCDHSCGTDYSGERDSKQDFAYRKESAC